jgi:hypothetical protein
VSSAFIAAPAGIVVETPALRIPTTGEVDWRIRAHSPGRYQVRIAAGGQAYDKEVVVGGQGGPVSPVRSAASAIQQFLHPGEPPLPAQAAVRSIAVSYPTASLRFFGHELHWVWAWLVLSMAVGMVLKGPLRVQL